MSSGSWHLFYSFQPISSCDETINNSLLISLKENQKTPKNKFQPTFGSLKETKSIILISLLFIFPYLILCTACSSNRVSSGKTEPELTPTLLGHKHYNSKEITNSIIFLSTEQTDFKRPEHQEKRGTSSYCPHYHCC